MMPKKLQVQEDPAHEMTSTGKNPQHCRWQRYVDTAIDEREARRVKMDMDMSRLSKWWYLWLCC